ncbi:MAG: hypothetical protein V3V08_01210 [Nannocystaceae bacterium]
MGAERDQLKVPGLVTPKRRLLLSLLAIVFLGAQLLLGVRGLVTRDNRYGWGMFGHQVNFAIRYHYVRSDGKTKRFKPDLRGKARKYGGKAERTRYGIGAVRTLVTSILEHEFEHRPSRAIVACKATITYEINQSGDPIREVLLYPPEADQ